MDRATTFLALLGTLSFISGARLPPCERDLRSGRGIDSGESDEEAGPDLLFTQQAHEAILQVINAGDIYAEFGATLTLTGVSPTTTWFTDKPRRRAGHMATGVLTSSPVFFKETTAGSDEVAWLGAPNALLTGVVGNGSDGHNPASSVILTLYDPDYDLEARRLTYTATLIPKDAPRDGKLAERGVSTYALEDPEDGWGSAPMHAFSRHSEGVTFRFPSLFIDDYLADLPGTCTFQRMMAGNCTCPAVRADGYCGTDLNVTGPHPVIGAGFGTWGNTSPLDGYNRFSQPNGFLYRSYYG